jgi:hypothetical protein
MLRDEIHADVRGHATLTLVLSAIGGTLTAAAVLGALAWAVLRDDVADRLIGAAIFLALAGAMWLVLRRVMRGPAWYRRATWVFHNVAPVTVHVQIVTGATGNHRRTGAGRRCPCSRWCRAPGKSGGSARMPPPWPGSTPGADPSW